MNKLLAILTILFVAACGNNEQPKPHRENCKVEKVDQGALVICPNSKTMVYNGTDGKNGAAAVIDLIDPCGDYPHHPDEVIMRLSDGTLVAYFQEGNRRFLAELQPGNYMTTDKQSCYFSVTKSGEVIYE